MSPWEQVSDSLVPAASDRIVTPQCLKNHYTDFFKREGHLRSLEASWRELRRMLEEFAGSSNSSSNPSSRIDDFMEVLRHKKGVNVVELWKNFPSKIKQRFAGDATGDSNEDRISEFAHEAAAHAGFL